jgi:hypothetical protein
MTSLLLKRASASHSSGEWNDDYDVLADSEVVGRIMKVHAAPVGTPWMWTLAFWHQEDRTPTHGYEATLQGRDGRLCQELAAGMQPYSLNARSSNTALTPVRSATRWTSGECP